MGSRPLFPPHLLEENETLFRKMAKKISFKNRIGVQSLMVMPSKLWRFEWSERDWKLGELGEVSFRILKLSELGEMSFGMLKLGELGEMSFRIYKLCELVR